MYYAEACNEFAGPISRSLCLRATQLLSTKMYLQRWRAVGSTVPDLTAPRLEFQASDSRDERVTARLIIRS